MKVKKFTSTPNFVNNLDTKKYIQYIVKFV